MNFVLPLILAFHIALYISKPSEDKFEEDSFPQILSILCVFVPDFQSLNENWYSLEGNEQNKT